ncbi:MAG: hypothetical protein ABID61_01540 [Candidatus Micrarchaeota archaeon]
MNEYKSDQSWAQNIVDKHKVGSSVSIIINPVIPGQSALQSDIKIFHWGILTLFILAFIFYIASTVSK